VQALPLNDLDTHDGVVMDGLEAADSGVADGVAVLFF